MEKKQEIIIAVDFDGTCVTHTYPQIGRVIGAEKVLRRLVDEGYKLILWTMRSGESLSDAVNWFSDKGIRLYGIQTNPEQASWTSSPKAHAHLYIDDAALGAPLKKGLPGERPYIDWDKVSEFFWPKEKEDGAN